MQSGVLIIEGKKKSGSLITARYAKEQKKKMFCLPGNIDIKNSYGTNELIKMGAKLVTNVDDILEDIIEKQDNIEDELKINNECKKVYDIITNSPIHINDICRKIGITVADANQIITMLEIEGLIKSLPNNEYIREKKCI